MVGGAWIISTNGRGWHSHLLAPWALCWFGALIVSSLFNLHAISNELHAIWFCLALWLAYTVLSDLIANGILSRTVLADGILLGSVYPTISGIYSGWFATSRGNFSTFNNANYYATFLEFLMPLAWVRWRQTRRPQYFVLLCLILIGAFLSSSRGVFVAIVAAMLFLDRKRRWTYVLVGTPVIILTVFYRPSSVWARAIIYEYAWNEFLKSPVFGNGPFTFRNVLGGLRNSQAHNLILHIASELGIVGLILVATITAQLSKVYSRIEDSMQKAWATSLVMTSAHQLVDVTWLHPILSLLMIISLTASIDLPTSRPIKHQRIFSMVVVFIAISLGILAWRNGGVSQEILTGVVGW